MNLIEYPDTEVLMLSLANRIAGDLENYLFEHDHASLVVPGGTTPGPIFDALCAADLDWSRVHVMLSDERWVPETSERSNTALIRERLLTDRASAATFIPFYSGDATPEEGLPKIIPLLDAELPIAVLLLGMGADMHTASLFPGADNLEPALAQDAPALMAMRAPGAPEPRITLTAPVLRGAMTTHVVITGDEKRAALEKAAELDPLQAPIKVVWREADVHWAAK